MAAPAPLLLFVPQVRVTHDVVRRTLRAVPSPSARRASMGTRALDPEVPHACRPLRPEPDASIFDELLKRRRRAQIAARRLMEGRS